MNSRACRFVQSTSSLNADGISLNEIEQLFCKVPEKIDLRDSLLLADLDADYIMEKTARIIARGRVVKKYKLDADEAMCISSYTLEVPAKNGKSPYRLLNEVLSGRRDERSLIKIRPLLVLLLRSLRKLPPVEKNVLYRGIILDAKKDMVGDEAVFWGFTSASTSLTVTSSFSSGSSGRLLVIEGPVKGYDIKDFSEFPSEEEVLLEPELFVEIYGKEKDKNVIQCRIKPSNSVLPNAAPFEECLKTKDPEIEEGLESPLKTKSSGFSLSKIFSKSPGGDKGEFK